MYSVGESVLHKSKLYRINHNCKLFLLMYTFNIQSRPGTTCTVIRRIVPPDFSAARGGKYVEIMVNNVTVILVVQDGKDT